MNSTTTIDDFRLTTEIAQLWPPQGHWTETDYFNLPDTSRIVELSEGEIVLRPQPSFTHQKVLDNLYSALKAHVQAQELGVTAFAPLAIRLWPGKIREPGIMFFADAHRERIGELVSGPPDLVMEIISPGSRKTDRHDKFYEYAQAQIAEYWLVDPENETVEVFVLNDGVYLLLDKFEGQEQARSKLLTGFTVDCKLVFT